MLTTPKHHSVWMYWQKKASSETVQPMEMYKFDSGVGQSYGYIIYRKQCGSGNLLELPGRIRDHAQVGKVFGEGGGEVIGLIAWRKEEWRKEAADIPSSKVENDLCSTRQILALFREQPWGDCWETGLNTYGPFRGLRCHLKLKQTETDWRGGGGGRGGTGGQLSVNVVLFSEGLHSELFTLQQSLLVALIYKDIDCVQLVFIKHFYSKSLCSIRITNMGSWKSSVGYNNNNNNNNNERICRVPVHVKHAQLRWTGANTKIQNTCMWDTQNSRCPIQIMLLKHPTKHKKKYP